MSEAFDFSNYEFYRLNNLILKYQRFTAPGCEDLWIWKMCQRLNSIEKKKNNFKNEFLQTIFFTSKKLYFISKSYQVEDIIIYTNIIF